MYGISVELVLFVCMYSYVILLHCSGPCNNESSNHIGIYQTYYVVSIHLLERVCGFRTYERIVYGRWIYITFYTNGQINSHKRRGFSKIEYIAQGLFNVIIFIINKMYELFQTLMNVNQKYIFAMAVV